MRNNENENIEDEYRTGLINKIDVIVARARLHDDYPSNVLAFRDKHKIPSGGFSSVSALDEWALEYFSDKDRSYQYRKDLYKLSHKIGINSSQGSNYIQALELELQFNNNPVLFSAEDYSVKTIFNNEKHRKELWLEIYPNTRRDAVICSAKWKELIAPRLKASNSAEIYKKDRLVCVVTPNKTGSDTILLRLTGTTQSMIRKYWSRDVRSVQEKQIGFKRNSKVKEWVLNAEVASTLRDRGYSSEKIKETLKGVSYDCYQINTLLRDRKRLIRPLPNSK